MSLWSGFRILNLEGKVYFEEGDLIREISAKGDEINKAVHRCSNRRIIGDEITHTAHIRNEM